MVHLDSELDIHKESYDIANIVVNFRDRSYRVRLRTCSS